MIECKIEEPAQDITPELVVSAYNVLRQYCIRCSNCEGCGLADNEGECLMRGLPEAWPEMKNP